MYQDLVLERSQGLNNNKSSSAMHAQTSLSSCWQEVEETKALTSDVLASNTRASSTMQNVIGPIRISH